MTFAYWCVLAAALLPYATVAIAKIDRTYNNRKPRDWEEQLTGYRRRAHFAHLNHFEAFAPFAAGVIVAHLLQVSQNTVDGLALGFVAARLAYTGAYLADLHALRSLLWMAGMGCVVALFAAGALR